MSLKAGFVMLGCAVFSLCPGAADEEDSNLPGRAVLIQREYEKARSSGIIKLNRSFIERYEEVKKEYLKLGDIDGSVAIEDEIKRLEAEIIRLEAGTTITSVLPTSNERTWFIGTRWRVSRGSGNTYIMSFDRKNVTHFHKGKSPKFQYEYKGNGIVKYQGGFQEITLKFNTDQTTGTYTDENGQTGTITLIKK